MIRAIENFVKDIESVCRAHGLSISHEDGQGAFIIEDYNSYNIEWLASASDERKESK